MNAESMGDIWKAADAYEAFMGRWSRLVAGQLVHWLKPDSDLSWLDVGCGTGALTSAICDLASPKSIVACDPSEPFVEHVRRSIADTRVEAVLAGAGNLPGHPGGFDRVVSGLVLNHLPDPRAAVEEMRARTRIGGMVAAYVWDYAGRMEFLRYFWDEAVALDERASTLDQGKRFPICQPDALASLFRAAGLRLVSADALETSTRFNSFSDYWQPFTCGTGAAPAYVSSLTAESREALRDRLERRLTARPDGSIELVARAWAVQGTVS